jgi:hypothetical protein
MKAIKKSPSMNERRFTLNRCLLALPRQDHTRIMVRAYAQGGGLQKADTAKDAKRAFVSEGRDYYYLRSRKHLLAQCVWICPVILSRVAAKNLSVRAAHRGKMKASRLFDQEA